MRYTVMQSNYASLEYHSKKFNKNALSWLVLSLSLLCPPPFGPLDSILRGSNCISDMPFKMIE